MRPPHASIIPITPNFNKRIIPIPTKSLLDFPMNIRRVHAHPFNKLKWTYLLQKEFSLFPILPVPPVSGIDRIPINFDKLPEITPVLKGH
jgi:hypothetical protein